MTHCFQQFIQSVLLAITIFAFGASVQAQTPLISSTPTTPAKNAKPIIEPRKMVDTAAFRTAVSEARTAMDAGDFVVAEKAYAQAIAADPLNPRAYFNHGVAQYKSGNLKAASESFAAAAQIGDEGLAAQAMFNQGNAVYADALKQIDADGSGSKGDIAGAIEAVTSALTHFKDAAAADQSDIDARVNAETAARLLKNLEEIKKKQDEQKKDEKKEEQQKQEQQKQDQQKQDQQKQDQQKNEQGEPKDEPKGEPQDGQQPKDGQQKKDEKKPTNATPDDSKDGKEKPQKQKSEEGDSDQAQDKQPAAGEPVKDAPLTKQEAERLLQAVRDREKSRKEAKEQAQPTRRIPASKDW